MAKIKVEGKVKITVYKDGRIIGAHEQELHSFVRNFDHLLALLFAGNLYGDSAAVTLKDVYGNDVDVYGIRNLSYAAPIIWLGEGTTPPSPDDYTLESVITRFNAAIHTFTYDAQNRTVTVEAKAGNAGAEVTVTEAGLILNTYIYKDSAGTRENRFFLIIRDLLSEPVTVPTNAIVHTRYTLTVKVSGE